MSLREDLIRNISNRLILKELNETKRSPSVSLLNKSSSNLLDNILNPDLIPFIEYKSQCKSEDYNNQINNIVYAIQSVSDSIYKKDKEYRNIVYKYSLLYNRLNNMYNNIQNDISNILQYSCYNIDTNFYNHDIESNVIKIGKFLMLPFFIKNTSIYNGNISISVSTNGITTFSNISEILEIPFIKDPSIKIKSSSDKINASFAISLLNIETNCIYAKFSNDINKISLTAIYNGIDLYSKEYTGNEIIINFEPNTINAVRIDIEIINTNKDKPSSIQLEKLYIFNNMQFSSNASFISKDLDIKIPINSSSLSLSHKNINESTNIEVDQLLSISNDNKKNFNKINKEEIVNISFISFKKYFDFKYNSLVDKDIFGLQFKTLNINDTSYYNADFLNSIILNGINDKYCNISYNAKEMFDNWTNDGNYYYTYLLNNEDNIFINSGNKEFYINDSLVKGMIKIPNGISKIKVHTKDINISTFDPLIKTNNTELNFAYIFSGLPKFDIDGNITEKLTKTFNLYGQEIITLNTPFIPMTETVVDSNGVEYKRVLGKTTDTPGTYTISPNNGLINIFPLYTNSLITVTYLPSDTNQKPCGILFKSYLSYKELNSINQSNYSNSFSVDGSPNNTYLILPAIENIPNKSQILFNSINDKSFISVKLLLKTKSKYISPIIDTISISLR